MQRKYGKDGLVILTVATDPPGENARVEAANKIISGHKELPANVLFKGEASELEAKMGYEATPTIFIFNRHNRWVKKLPEKNSDGDIMDPKYEDIDKLVEGLLKK